MKRTWLIVGGFLDGEMRELRDEEFKDDEVELFAEMGTTVNGENIGGTPFSIRYKAELKGGITNEITGGLLVHHRMNRVQTFTQLMDHYARTRILAIKANLDKVIKEATHVEEPQEKSKDEVGQDAGTSPEPAI